MILGWQSLAVTLEEKPNRPSTVIDLSRDDDVKEEVHGLRNRLLLIIICDRLWENRPIGADIGIEQ